MPRLKDKYQNEVLPALMKEFGYSNIMAAPRLVKIVVNVGMGEAIQNPKLLDVVCDELAAITGQRPMVRRARKAIAAFKLRQGMNIGASVTLRGDRMHEFLDRLMNIGLPRVRDFRGVSPKAFDGRGNYTIGIKDQLIFPEIDLTKTDYVHGMNITLVTTAQKDQEAFFLLQKMGMPFSRPEERRAAAVG